jgi:hypothetical protein
MADVFLSYSQLDDRQGWVTRFRANLELRLSEVLGRPATVFIDRQLDGATPLSKLTATLLDEASILVPVLSPSYFGPQATWTGAELEHFLQRFDEAPPVFKAIKLVSIDPARDRNAQPERIRQYLGYEFFREHGAGTIELDEDGVEYWERMNDLAYAMARRLQPTAVRIERVFLAEVSSDLAAARLALKRELLSRSFQVSPESRMPARFEHAEAATIAELRAATISVHMAGKLWGAVAESEILSDDVEAARRASESTIVQQLRLARRTADSGSCRSVLWLPRDVKDRDPRLKECVDALRKDPGNLALVEGDFDDLKRIVVELLSKVPPFTAATAAKPHQRTYLIYERADQAGADQIQHAELYRLPFIDDERARDQLHQQLLDESHGVLLYWGGATQNWLLSSVADVTTRASAGSSRSVPLAKKAVYVAAPGEKAPPKQYFDWPHWRILRDTHELDRFLRE